jgi:hypothetical protein
MPDFISTPLVPSFPVEYTNSLVLNSSQGGSRDRRPGRRLYGARDCRWGRFCGWMGGIAGGGGVVRGWRLMLVVSAGVLAVTKLQVLHNLG